jgi:hypothetical protein
LDRIRSPLYFLFPTVATTAKRKALLHLVNTPQQSCTASTLAHAVRISLGKSLSDLGCSQSFKQVLREEPQVFVFGPGPSQCEALVPLNAKGVLDQGHRPGSWCCCLPSDCSTAAAACQHQAVAWREARREVGCYAASYAASYADYSNYQFYVLRRSTLGGTIHLARQFACTSTKSPA